MSTITFRSLLAAGTIAALATPALAGPGYLKIGDIKGESQEFTGSGPARALDNPDAYREAGWMEVSGIEWTDADGVDAAIAALEADATSGTRGSNVDIRVNRIEMKGVAPDGGDDDSDGDSIDTRDAATGLPTGKRQHKPFTVTKEVDKATPMMARGGPASGRATGKRQHSAVTVDDDGEQRREVRVRRELDKASPAMARGGIDKSTPYLMVSGRFDTCEVGSTIDALSVSDESGTYVLRDAMVAACMGSTSSDRPTEEVAFYYNKIAFSYASKDAVIKGSKINEN